MKRKFKLFIITLFTAQLLVSHIAFARQGQGKNRNKKNKIAMGQKMRGHGPRAQIIKHLYPVGLVKRFMSELELSNTQMKKLKSVVTSVRHEMDQLKWDIDVETAKLVNLVKNNASKDKIYAQMDIIFRYENKIKKKRMGLLIVVRDILSTKQRAILDKKKSEMMDQPGFSPPHGPPRGGMHGPQF